MTLQDNVPTNNSVRPRSINHTGQISQLPLAGELNIRMAQQRGMANLGWLRSSHSFSFADYFDPEHMQFENLRVINEDIVAAGGGFPNHPHRDAEIFSYVLEGTLEHKDSLGNGSTVKAGGVQYMSAGSGVTHCELNPSKNEPAHFLQIWLLPNEKGGTARYDTLDIEPSAKNGKLKLFLSRDGRDGSMPIKSDADIYAATLDADQSITTVLEAGHKAWIQMAKGSMTVNGKHLHEGDGLSISKAGRVEFNNAVLAEFIYFDLF